MAIHLPKVTQLKAGAVKYNCFSRSRSATYSLTLSMSLHCSALSSSGNENNNGNFLHRRVNRVTCVKQSTQCLVNKFSHRYVTVQRFQPRAVFFQAGAEGTSPHHREGLSQR